ncbi:Citramalyl-CoA lyase [Paramyrothecium foliicola]|nr:Citramalyl-CoA lyase [Paramyrothecium foliicola]
MSLSKCLRRAMLYVPGSSKKMLAKSTVLNVDSVIYDLEDSVSPESKELARSLVADHIAGETMLESRRGPQEVSVRINAIETDLALQDITQILKVGSNLNTIVIPKVQSAADLQFVADVVRHVNPHRTFGCSSAATSALGQPADASPSRPINFIGLIESAMGLVNVLEICRVGRKLGLAGLGFAAEDFMASLELSKLPDRREVLLARSTIVNACRAYGIPCAIDMVSVNVEKNPNDQTLEVECREGRSLGFTGKQAIHPSQIGAIQQAFGPSDSEVEWATRVYIGDDEARKRGKGAWSLDGRMIDAPAVKAATSLIDKARLCGMDVDSSIARMRADAFEGKLKQSL